MNDNYYPDIDAHSVIPFNVIVQGMMGDPLWLERAGCPYEDDVKTALQSLWELVRTARPAGVTREPRPQTEGDQWEGLIADMMAMFRELRDYSTQIDITDVKEQMSYYRTAGAMLERLTGLIERMHNVKAVSEFTTRVMGVFDDILTPEQRTLALTKLVPGGGAGV